MRALIAALLAVLMCVGTALATLSGGSITGGSIRGTVFTRSTGNQTNTTELDRFLALSAGEPYATDLTDLIGHADTARTAWPYEIDPGAWDATGGDCEPVGLDDDGVGVDEYGMELAATDIFAMVLAGYLGDETSANYSAARTRLLEFAATSGFVVGSYDGAEQCALDLGEAVFSLIEAAFLLEEAGYASWTADDRETFAEWLATDVFPLTSFGPEVRKSNWGIAILGTNLAIATYTQGGYATLTKWDASTVTPTNYLTTEGDAILAAWLSRTSDDLDSACHPTYNYGLQANGGFPDDLRRPSASGTADCNIASITSHSSDGTCSLAANENCGQSGGHFYQQKSTNALARVCELMRRYDGGGDNLSGDGSRCFDLTTHGGDDEALIDAAQFATGGDYTTSYIQDTTQGFRYVAGEYYEDAGLIAANDDGAVSVRGGRDFAYTKITHAPGVAYDGYEWQLGDLESYSTRLDIDWDHSSWADAYDTEAELNALGWTTVNITNNPCTDLYSNAATPQTTGSPDGRCDADRTTYDITCAAGGVDSSEDELAFNAILTDNCNTTVGSGLPNACNNVFKIAASCEIDVTAADTGASAPSESSPAISLNYSNVAIIGADRDTSKVSATNAFTATTNDGIGILFGDNSGWVSGAEAGTAYTWDAGDTAAKGQTSILISGDCTGLTHESSPDADGVDESTVIRVSGADADGNQLAFQTRINSKTGTTNCTIGLTDALPTDFDTHSNVYALSTSRQNFVILHNFTAGFPHIDWGICTGSSDQDCAYPFDLDGVNNFLVDNMNVGPYGVPGPGTRIYQPVIRHSDLGPASHGMRRSNNNNAFTCSGCSFLSLYDNVQLEGAIRTTVTTVGAMFGYYGFNYTIPQTAPNSIDPDVSSGNYCLASFSGGTFPGVAGGPERSYFMSHDGQNDANSAGESLGYFLVEANDTKCRFRTEEQADGSRYGTFYRNRVVGTDTQVEYMSTLSMPYLNWIANRLGTWSWGGGTNKQNALGLWNVAETSTSAPGGTGVEWPTSGTGKNYVDASVHDDYATTALPPSLGFRTDTAPSWWCQESGPWDETWSFAYADGGDNSGVPRKLPAQIRYEGGTCTPP